MPSDGTGSLVRILKEVPRSSILPHYTADGSRRRASSVDYARYAGMTPILMYAIKEAKGIRYGEWDKSDPNIIYFLGDALYKLLAFSVEFSSVEGTEEIARCRNEMLTIKTSGERKSNLAYKMNSFMYDHKLVQGSPLGMAMMLQTWLANVQFRVPDAMILDPWDWDNTPEAFDTVLETRDYTPNTLPW